MVESARSQIFEFGKYLHSLGPDMHSFIYEEEEKTFLVDLI